MKTMESKELAIRRNLKYSSGKGYVSLLKTWKCANVIDDWNNNQFITASGFEIGVIEQCL